MKRSRSRIITATLAALGTAAGTVALASPSNSAGPLTVKSTQLTQSGLDLTWRLTTASPLRPAQLAARGQTLCLQLTRRHAAQQLCLTAARSGKHRILLKRTSAAGKTSWPAVSVTRSGSHTLALTFAAADVNVTAGTYWTKVLASGRVSCPQSTATSSTSTSTSGTCIEIGATKSVAFRFHTPRLTGCVPDRSSVIFNGSRNKRVVALTFDDGPWPDPPSIDFVRLLHRMHAVGTFFEIGDQISEYDPTGSVERAMLADGDMIGDHSWSHPDMLKLSLAGQTQQLLAQRAAVQRKTGFTECLFRPPYGDFNSELVGLARSYGMATIQWDVDTVDWSRPGVASIYSTAVNDARNGSIILMHFGGGNREQTITALPMIIRTLRARGYSFVTVPELLGFRMLYR